MSIEVNKKFIERKQDILKWIKENKSKAFICREMMCKPLTLDNYLTKFNIKYKGNVGRRGTVRPEDRIPAKKYLGTNKYISSHKLKLKLIEEKIKDKKCERCNLRKWLNKDIPLELHHKNRNRFDNRLENLEIICSNCHALENIKKKENTPDRFCLVCNNKIENSNKRYCSITCRKTVIQTYKDKFCLVCNKKFNNANKKYCSLKCANTAKIGVSCEKNISQKKFDIDRNILERLVNSLPTTRISKIFRVSDSAIAKRCKKMGIEKPSLGFWAKKYSGNPPDTISIDEDIIKYLKEKGYNADVA